MCDENNVYLKIEKEGNNVYDLLGSTWWDGKFNFVITTDYQFSISNYVEGLIGS
jgi:hypothetical protein